MSVIIEFWSVSGVHLHELLEGSDVHLPEPVVPTRVNTVVLHLSLVKCQQLKRY